MANVMFVVVRQSWISGKTRDVLSIEVEENSGLGRLVGEKLNGMSEVEVAKDWPGKSIEDESNDSLKVIHGFLSKNANMSLRLFLGKKDLSRKMPDGGLSMKMSSVYLYESGRILWDNVEA